MKPPPAARRQSLETLHSAWRAMTIAQALDAATARFPERPFVITDEHAYTYSEIQAWSRRLAAGLIAHGVRRGDHVAMIMANYPEYVALKYAIARAGAVAVPINFLLRQRELSYILEQSDASLLIAMDRLRERDYLADLDALYPGWERDGGGSRLPKLRGVFVFSEERAARPGAKTLDDLAALATVGSENELAARETDADGTALSDVIYTSGTTGLPKGVMLSHDMILRAAYASAYTRAFEDGRRILFSLPMYHVFGYVECMIACMFVGGAIIPHITFDAAQMIEAAERHHASEIVCVPMMTLKLLEIARQRSLNGGSFNSEHLIAMFNSGGASPPTIWQDIRDLLGAREVLTAYGMSETTASTTCTLPEGPDERLTTSNGCFKQAGIAGDPALHGVLAQYKTIDPESCADLPVGTPGELVARGPIVTRGYYNKPDETKAAFTPDGWLRTGDVGVVDADGYLTLTGRIKETYRCGGEMVMPREIEEFIGEHPLVGQAFVVGIPDAKMGEVGCVCIVPAGDDRPNPQEIVDLCALKLARFKVPRYIIFVAQHEVPFTATGRVQKFRLAEIARERVSPEIALAPRRGSAAPDSRPEIA